MIDFFGHVSYAAITLGILWLGQKKAYGWLMKAVGDAGWAVLGIVMGMSSIFVWASLFIVMDFIGWAQWRKKATTKSNSDGYYLGRGVLYTKQIGYDNWVEVGTTTNFQVQLADDDDDDDLDTLLLREEW